jgi:hypothetical protein
MGYFFPNHKMHGRSKRRSKKWPAGQKTKRFQGDDELSGYHRKDGMAVSRSEIAMHQADAFHVGPTTNGHPGLSSGQSQAVRIHARSLEGSGANFR